MILAETASHLPVTPLSAFVTIVVACLTVTIPSYLTWRNSRAINRAVNHKPKDAPTLYSLVEHLCAEVDDVKTELGEVRAICDDTNATAERAANKISDHLAWHQEQHQTTEGSAP